jgi:hypothetical protein
VRAAFGFGLGHKHRRTAAATGITALTIVTAPVISGTTAIGDTLTVATPAVWSGTPASRIYQWYQDTTPISGATGTSYVTVTGDLGHSITVKEQANNGALSTASQSNAIVVASSGGFATPTLSNFSALGAAPLVLQGSTTDTNTAGLRGQLQIATDSGFSSIAQNIIFFIDGASWASNDIATGLVTPVGLYYARWRILRDNESGTTVTGNDPLGNALSFGADVSPWSNTFTDTISSSTAVLNSVTGVNKNVGVTVSGTPKLTFAGTNGTGATQPVRATIAQAADYAQFEVTLTSNPTASGLRVGWEDGTTSFASNVAPGTNNNLGVDIKMQSNGIFINWNSDGNGTTLTASAPLSGDVYSFRLKKSTHAVEVWRTRSGSTTQMGTTQTVPTFSAYFMWLGPLQNESGTVNFGATAFTKALDLGAVLYG